MRKHARVGSVAILLSYRSSGVVLAIKENGQGFAINQRQTGPQGFGLPAMCERTNRLGGEMDINTGLGTGTEITMSVPLSGRLQRKGTTDETRCERRGRSDQIRFQLFQIIDPTLGGEFIPSIVQVSNRSGSAIITCTIKS